MRSRALHCFLPVILLLTAAAASGFAQTTNQEHDTHHPGEAPGAQESQPAGPGERPAQDMQQGMRGMMGTMNPEIMRMMQGMMAMQQGGAGQPSAMMGPGMMTCPMLQAMTGMRAGADLPGMMGSHGMLYGMPSTAQEEMTPERVRTFLEQRLAWHGNPRLRLGKIATADDARVTAEIVTADGSLVQKLAFNRYPGLFRQIR